MNLGEKLKQLRLEKNLTQNSLQTDSVSQSAPSLPTNPIPVVLLFDTLIKYARIFHVSTDYLLGFRTNTHS